MSVCAIETIARTNALFTERWRIREIDKLNEINNVSKRERTSV